MIAGGAEYTLEQLQSEMNARGFTPDQIKFAESYFRVQGMDDGILKGQGLNPFEMAQKRLITLQADALAIRIENGGATPFEIKQHEEQVRQFNDSIQLNRQIEDRAARGERISQFLFAEGTLASMAGTLVAASKVGQPLPGYEVGGPLNKAYDRMGIEFTPSVIEARPVAPALMSLAGGSNLQEGDITDTSTRTFIETEATKKLDDEKGPKG